MSSILDCRLRIADLKHQTADVSFIIPQSARSLPSNASIGGNPQSKGFTLIEVLLALTILALIMTLIYSSFSTASQSVERAEKVRDATDLARTLIARMSNDIANASCSADPKVVVFYGKKDEVEAEGEKLRYDSIYLTTLTNRRIRDSKETEMWEVGYYFEERPDTRKRVLMRREKRELNKDALSFDFEITDRVEDMKLRYFSGSAWKDEWGGGTLCAPLPKAVEISLRLDDGSFYTTQVDVRR